MKRNEIGGVGKTDMSLVDEEYYGEEEHIEISSQKVDAQDASDAVQDPQAAIIEPIAVSSGA